MILFSYLMHKGYFPTVEIQFAISALKICAEAEQRKNAGGQLIVAVMSVNME